MIQNDWKTISTSGTIDDEESFRAWVKRKKNNTQDSGWRTKTIKTEAMNHIKRANFQV